MLSIDAAHRGGIGQCPECRQPFRIPLAPRDAPPAVEQTAAPGATAPPMHPAPTQSKERPSEPAFPRLNLSLDEPAGIVDPDPGYEVVDDGDEYETLEVDDRASNGVADNDFDVVAEVVEPKPPRSTGSTPDEEEVLDAIVDASPPKPARPRGGDDYKDRPRRRRRRRRTEREVGTFGIPEEIIPGLDNFLAILALLGIMTLGMGGLSLLFPPAGAVLGLVGSVVALAGQVWFVMLAFQEDLVSGLLCLLLPCYAFWFLLNNQDVVMRAFLLTLVGMGMSLVGSLGAGLSPF